LKGFILGVIVTLVLIAAGVYIYFSQGLAPVAASAQAMPFEKVLASKAVNARVEKEAPKTVPIQPSEGLYLAAAHEYVEHCAICRGLPGKPETDIARGEFPKPPQLFKGKGVTDDPAGEIYWVIENGIRLSGMSGFKTSLTDTQMWQLALLLANADKLPPSATAVLSGTNETQPTPATSAQPSSPTTK
jgi:thiosulfate dehydrogenase